jgi:hypothetical protein
VRRVGLALPPDHEALDDARGLVDLLLRHHRHALPAGRLRHERHDHHRDAGEVVADLLLADVEHLLQPQAGASIAMADCTSTRMSPECTGQRERLGRRAGRG